MKPFGDYIFIEKDGVKTETASGIVLSAEAAKREGAASGTIIEVGPEVKDLKPGTKVVFNEHQYDLLFIHKDTKNDILVGKKPGIYAYVA